jgi:hypothetical protein
LAITAPGTMTMGDPDGTITTSGGSGTGALSFSAGTSGACSISSDKLHALSATSLANVCSITATKAADGTYNEATSAPFSVTISTRPPVATSLLYTGTQIVILGPSANTVTPAAQLSSSASSCPVNNQTITFSIAPNPLTGIGSLPLPSYTTNSSGVATGSPQSTNHWLEGVYMINAAFSSTTNCLGSTDQGILTVGSAGDSANGGGWYTVSGSGRVNFGFVIQKVPNTNPTQYKGQMLLINKGKWRLMGSFSGTDAFAKTNSNQGGANGTGDLYWWNTSLNSGQGGWQLAKSAVAFTISFTGGGNAKKNACNGTNGQGCFGIQMSYNPVSPQPSKLPNSPPQPISGGSIKVN